MALLRSFFEDQSYVLLDGPPTEAQRLQHPKLLRFESEINYAAFRTPVRSPVGIWLTRALERAFWRAPGTHPHGWRLDPDFAVRRHRGPSRRHRADGQPGQQPTQPEREPTRLATSRRASAPSWRSLLSPTSRSWDVQSPPNIARHDVDRDIFGFSRRRSDRIFVPVRSIGHVHAHLVTLGEQGRRAGFP